MDKSAAFDSILATKLHPPPITSDIVPRPRLLEILERGRSRAMTLISAPAGYGKSILASQWLEECRCPGAWVSLDEDDGDLRGVLSYIVAAVHKAFPDLGLKTRSLLQAGEIPPPKTLARYLLNDLEQVDEPFVLVLDDYHRIREAAVHDTVTEMLRYPSPKLHLAILTRRDPPLPLHSLRAGGQLTEIGVNQIRFTMAETREFLERLVRVSLDEDTAAVLEERVEGWVTGLRLAALSMGQEKDYDRMMEELKDGSHYVQEYLIQEVISHVPPAFAGYLLGTSLLERFCAPLCEAVWLAGGEPGEDQTGHGMEDFLGWLEGTRLFVIPLDARHRWFRYHHLFQQLLQRELRKTLGPGEIEAIHRRAGAWFAGNGHVEEALRHLLAGSDVDAAAKLVDDNRMSALNNDRWQVFEKWLSMFPEAEIQKRPGLLLARAWLHMQLYEVQKIPAIIDVAESMADRPPMGEPLRAEMDFFRGYISYILNDGVRSLKHLKDARSGVPDAHFEVKGQIELIWALASQMEGEAEEAVRTLEDTISRGDPHPIRMTRLQAALSYVHIISGDLDEAAVVSRGFQDFSTEHGYDFARAWAVYLRGCICFHRNELGKAIGCFGELSELRHISHNRAAVDGMAGLALAYEAAGHPDRADRALRDLSEYCDSLRDPSYSVAAASCGARFSIMRGDLGKTLSWLRGEVPPVENMLFWVEVPCVTYCRGLLAEGSDSSLEEAEKRLTEYLELNRANHNICHTIYVLVLLAMVYDGLDRLDDTLAMLERAVIAADPGGFVRPFAEVGLPMIDLLNILIEQESSVEPVERLLAALERPQPEVQLEDSPRTGRPASPARKSQPGRGVPPGEPIPELTRRELEILELLPEGLSNKEIAEKLFISTETVKSHLYNLCQKFGVHGRLRAVKRARELGIIQI